MNVGVVGDGYGIGYVGEEDVRLVERLGSNQRFVSAGCPRNGGPLGLGQLDYANDS